MLANSVTNKVSRAPAIIRKISLSDLGAGPLMTGCTAGNRYGAASNAIAAAHTENTRDAGISDSTMAAPAQTDSETVNANGHSARCATWA
ncbi:hypothetical protein D3C72_1919450 [compost metagenome]